MIMMYTRHEVEDGDELCAQMFERNETWERVRMPTRKMCSNICPPEGVAVASPTCELCAQITARTWMRLLDPRGYVSGRDEGQGSLND